MADRAPASAPRVPIPPPSATALGEDDIPPQLRAFIGELEEWAEANERDVRRDTVRFWTFKLPAVVSSASAGLLALAHLEVVAAILAAVGSACVIIDAVNPGGQLRNAHLRAVYDLRELEHDATDKWRIGALKGTASSELAAEILEGARKVRDKVASDLKAAETSFAQPSTDQRKR